MPLPRDPHVRDLAAWEAEPVTVGYGDDVAGRGSLNNRIARLVSRALRDTKDDGGLTRNEVAQRMAVYIFTMKVAEQTTGLFAVTWTQALLLQGRSYFDGPTPGVAADPADGPPEGLIFDVDFDEELPTEIRALMSREEVP